MKRLIRYFLLIGFCLTFICCNEKEKENYMIINGQRIEYSGKSASDNAPMIPVAQLFASMGFSIKKDGDILDLERNDDHYMLDLNNETLTTPEKPWDNYLSAMPGETGEWKIIYRSEDDLFVCERYIYSMFQRMGGSVDIKKDEKTGTIIIDATVSRGRFS